MVSEKILVVFGVTGNQGGSVASYVLSHPELKKQYKLRGVTRDVDGKKAIEMSKLGVDMVSGDLNDLASLVSALKGADTVFAMTVSSFSQDPVGTEFAQGKNIADAAVAVGARHIIWSTLPYAGEISSGSLNTLYTFDAKAKVEEYIKPLPIKANFFSPSYFMQNFLTYMKPRKNENGSFSVYCSAAGNLSIPFINIGETGKFVAPFLKSPDTFNHATIEGVNGYYTFEAAVKHLAVISKKIVSYEKVSESEMDALFPPPFGKFIVDIFALITNYGYYGKHTNDFNDIHEKISDKLTSFDSFLVESHFSLDD